MALSKSILTLIFLVLIFGFCSERQAPETADKNKEEIQQKFNAQELVNSWVSMWNSYDLSLVDELFLTDTNVTYFSSEKEGLIKGIYAIREHHKGFGFVEGGKTQDNRLWVENLQTNIYWPSAIVTGIWFFQRGSEDPPKIERGPVTFVYVQKENEYRLAHMHFADYE